MKNVSPLGFIIGDEGSGAVIGKTFIGDLLKKQTTAEIEELFSNEIITSINANALTIDIQSLNDEIVFSPKDLLTHLLGTKMFIISPYDYIELVNKYFIKKTIFERKKSSRCILCGSVAPLNGKLICNKHFGQR